MPPTSVAVDFLRKHIQSGGIELRTPDGRIERLGPDAPSVQWEIRREGTLTRILLNPALRLGETYMDADWNVPNGQLADLLRLLRSNLAPHFPSRMLARMLGTLLQSWNSLRTSARNVRHHYDLPHELFRRMLDSEMHYSCAFFSSENISLEDAQRRKAEHIRKKLLLNSRSSVLDIGCGWGSLALHLAQESGVRVTGLTLSQHQYDFARERAIQRGLDQLVDIRLEDFRQHRGSYDAIVSVGMFEHVGRRNYRTFFRRIRELLNPRGVVLLHTIGQSHPPTPSNPWIKKHIFPGGYIPALSEVVQAVEHSLLVTTDVEVWRRHYATTLHEWNRRFQAVRERFVNLKGERFCRMWEFYLAACETAFELDDLVVFQLQLAAENDTVPATRNYLSAAESASSV